MSEEYNTNINTQGSDPEKEQETTAVQEEKGKFHRNRHGAGKSTYSRKSLLCILL